MTINRLADETMDKVFGLPADAAARTTGTRLMREALRLLAHGEPITVAQLSAAAGLDADLDLAPAGADIEYDEQGRIVGWGLTLNLTPHRFTLDMSSTPGAPRTRCCSRPSSAARRRSNRHARPPAPRYA